MIKTACVMNNREILPLYDYEIDGVLEVGETILIYEDGTREKIKTDEIKRKVKDGRPTRTIKLRTQGLLKPNLKRIRAVRSPRSKRGNPKFSKKTITRATLPKS